METLLVIGDGEAQMSEGFIWLQVTAEDKGGWEIQGNFRAVLPTVLRTRFAELLSDMYTQTLNAVTEHSFRFVPADLPAQTRSRLIRSLDSWHFEPHKLPEEELLACTLILFEVLFRIEGMQDIIGVNMTQISALVHHLRHIYRLENSYHNFEHALDVLQATHCYLQSAGMVPALSILLEPDQMWKSEKAFNSGPLITCLGLRDIFALYIAAIGHDVGHPGFSNVFMKNAQTPLSLVFDGQSALEQMHCQLLLRVMRYHGLGELLDGQSEGYTFRKSLWYTVMATDMSVHADFMERFEQAIAGEALPLCIRQVVISQAILKCADISNPSRPFPVSEHWAAALAQEWSSQALLEESLDLKPTVTITQDPLSEAKGQVFFISTFAKPLLDFMVEAIPEMSPYANTCKSNLKCWQERVSKLQSSTTTSIPIIHTKAASPISPARNPDYQTAFPLSLPPSHRHNSSDEPSLIWPTPYTRSSASSTSSGSIPCSPSDSTSSSFLSPVSDSSTSNHHPTSSSGNSSTGHSRAGPIINDSHLAIRTAGKLGIRQHKNINRNSWCATSSSSNSSTTVSAAVSTVTTPQVASPLSASVQSSLPTKSSVALLVSTSGAGARKSGSPMKSPGETTIVVGNPMKLHTAKQGLS